MKLAKIYIGNKETLCLAHPRGWIPLSRIDRQKGKNWSNDLLSLVQSAQLSELNDWYNSDGFCEGEVAADSVVPRHEAEFAPLYRHPPKIWGIGLNYADHARDLDEKTPENIPGSFMKPATTVIGHGDEIHIPVQSEKTTAEAELGIVIGKTCKNVERENWRETVAGFTCIIDMTAEDILRKNTRYLTLSKSFDTFFSFGPALITPDEIEDVNRLTVTTVINDQVHAENIVENMTFPPDFLVSFLSTVMTLLPGDIISTGTPGAVHIRHGDTVSCCISGFEPLINPVVDDKIA
jgi:2-keto-4-pentenoate hydratase/2-oxohepta-3-ene-1,7-dioic acid hydratase in catechol pathway